MPGTLSWLDPCGARRVSRGGQGSCQDEGWETGEAGPGVLLGSDCWSDLAEAYVPPQIFYNGKVDYFDLQRLGGLLSHLRKTLKGARGPVGGEQGSS